MAVQSDTTSAPFVTAPSSEISNVYREGIVAGILVPPRLRFGFSSSTFSARGPSIHPVCWAALFSIAALRLTGRRP